MKQFALGLIAGITLTAAAANAQLVTGIWLGWKVYGERGLICRSPSVYPAMQTIECR